MKVDWNNAHEIGRNCRFRKAFQDQWTKNEVTPFLVLLSSYGYRKLSLKTEWRI